MDIKNLTTFVYTAELGSFTKAAEMLGFSQSTVSFQIKQLEIELDAQLFERINRTVALTDKGREVLGYAHQMLKMTQELVSSIRRESEAKGHVRLAMAGSLCHSLLQKDFSLFRGRFPGISLKIIAADTEEMFRLIDHNEADAILTLDKRICAPEYVTVREERASVHFVAGSASPLAAAKGPLLVQDLAGQPFLLTEKGMSYRRLMDERLAEMGAAISPVLETGRTDIICRLVCQGIGVAFLPDFVTEQDVRAGRMVRLPVEDFALDIWKQLIHHRDKWMSPAMEAVLAYCGEREFCAPRVAP